MNDPALRGSTWWPRRVAHRGHRGWRSARRGYRPGTLTGVTHDDNTELLDRLRAGDEQAFTALVGRYQVTMLTLASGYVPSRAVAEEVVQDTWLAVLRGLNAFEGRSSVRTWLFRPGEPR